MTTKLINLLEETIKELKAKEETKEAEFQVGDVVHCWVTNEALGKCEMGILQELLSPALHPYPYKVGNTFWAHIAKPIDIPGIYIRWTGGGMPKELEGKRITIWRRDGCTITGWADDFSFKHLGAKTDIIGYLVMPQEDK